MKNALLIVSFIALSSCRTTSTSGTLAGNPGDYEDIFDGNIVKLETFAGKNILEDNWTLRDGILKTPNGPKVDALTVRNYQNFHVVFEFKLHKNSNSGVKIMIKKSDGPIGPEFQILDAINHSDGKNGKNRHTSSLYDVFVGKPELVNELEQWNTGEIIVNGNRVEHRLNGKTALIYELGGEKILKAKLNSKFKNKSFFGHKRPGRILFQGHGEVVSYRSIRIKEL